MTVRPTRACAGALAVAVGLNLLARITGDGWLALASAAALALPLASFVLRPPLTALTVELDGPARVLAGSAFEQQLMVTNTSSRVSPPVTWAEAAGQPVAVPALEPGESCRLPVSRAAMGRGEYDGSGSTLTTVAPFGQLRWTAALPATGRLLVHPTTDRGRPLRSGGMLRGDPVSTAVAGTGIEVLGVRPWRPGDSAHAVSARATARHGRPVVLERERETESGPALVVLASGGSTGPRWESQVSYAASVALAALRAGRPVTLLAGEGGPESPRRVDATAVLDFFAAVDRAGPLDAAATQLALRSAHPGGTVLQLRGLRAGANRARTHDSNCCQHEVLDA